jgi:hypothetical protein
VLEARAFDTLEARAFGTLEARAFGTTLAQGRSLVLADGGNGLSGSERQGIGEGDCTVARVLRSHKLRCLPIA